MNFVHSKSEECTKTELDFFSVPPTQVSLEKGLWIDHQPVSSVLDAGPITFLCPATEDYMDLSKAILVVRAKVTKANGNDLDADEKVSIVNNFQHSLFKQVETKKWKHCCKQKKSANQRTPCAHLIDDAIYFRSHFEY